MRTISTIPPDQAKSTLTLKRLETIETILMLCPWDPDRKDTPCKSKTERVRKQNDMNCGDVAGFLFHVVSVCTMRNSTCDSCDVAIETGADLAKTRKSQITFPSLNATKITPV
jgi:hypothetical protein